MCTRCPQSMWDLQVNNMNNIPFIGKLGALGIPNITDICIIQNILYKLSMDVHIDNWTERHRFIMSYNDLKCSNIYNNFYIML